MLRSSAASCISPCDECVRTANREKLPLGLQQGNPQEHNSPIVCMRAARCRSCVTSPACCARCRLRQKRTGRWSSCLPAAARQRRRACGTAAARTVPQLRQAPLAAPAADVAHGCHSALRLHNMSTGGSGVLAATHSAKQRKWKARCLQSSNVPGRNRTQQST